MGLRWAKETSDSYWVQVRGEYGKRMGALDDDMGRYLRGLQEVYPDSTFWPDANSTLRLTFGRMEGSEPRDAVTYKPFTTAKGVLDKYVPGDAEFDLPEGLVDQLRREEYGPYADAEGNLRVCFLGSNHTTGGNSGSPAINATGDLIGLNFGRTWESTMSDVRFDADRCRNIMVDIRYVLWVTDVYAGAGHLVDEMTSRTGTRTTCRRSGARLARARAWEGVPAGCRCPSGRVAPAVHGAPAARRE